MTINNDTVKVVNIAQKLSLFQETWNPKIVGELNNHKVQVVKLKGKFNWHHHDNEDELFIVIRGHLVIHLQDKDLPVNEGEFIIIPHPIEHMPEALDDVEILLIEPKETLNTGNTITANTVKDQERI